jgi:hypothetical protein
METKCTHPSFGQIISVAAAILLIAYVGAYFIVSEVGFANDPSGTPTRLRDFDDQPWLCRVYQPMVWAESKLVGEMGMCHAP